MISVGAKGLNDSLTPLNAQGSASYERAALAARVCTISLLGLCCALMMMKILPAKRHSRSIPMPSTKYRQPRDSQARLFSPHGRPTGRCLLRLTLSVQARTGAIANRKRGTGHDS